MKGKVEKLINQAMEERGLIAEPFTAPPKINGKDTKIVTVRDNIIKIQAHDPIAFLIKVMNGEPIPHHFIDEEGQITTIQGTVKMEQRIRVAQFLANKVMPTMHLIKAVSEDDETPVKTGFDALVDQALQKGRILG